MEKDEALFKDSHVFCIFYYYWATKHFVCFFPPCHFKTDIEK